MRSRLDPTRWTQATLSRINIKVYHAGSTLPHAGSVASISPADGDVATADNELPPAIRTLIAELSDKGFEFPLSREMIANQIAEALVKLEGNAFRSLRVREGAGGTGDHRLRYGRAQALWDPMASIYDDIRRPSWRDKASFNDPSRAPFAALTSPEVWHADGDWAEECAYLASLAQMRDGGDVRLFTVRQERVWVLASRVSRRWLREVQQRKAMKEKMVVEVRGGWNLGTAEGRTQFREEFRSMLGEFERRKESAQAVRELVARKLALRELDTAAATRTGCRVG